jgi:hypothetical protein
LDSNSGFFAFSSTEGRRVVVVNTQNNRTSVYSRAVHQAAFVKDDSGTLRLIVQDGIGNAEQFTLNAEGIDPNSFGEPVKSEARWFEKQGATHQGLDGTFTAFSEDRRYAAYGDRNGSIRIFDAHQKERRTIYLPNDTPVSHLHFEGDRTLHVQWSDSTQIAIWELP